jgi:predicted nucleic acid-binding protein
VILVDSSVRVAALRRGPDLPERQELDLLLQQDEVATTDIVIAEVLQGARPEIQFRELQDSLSSPHYFHAERSTWKRAAELSFELKRSGQFTPLSGLLIASVATENELEVFTLIETSRAYLAFDCMRQAGERAIARK